MRIGIDLLWVRHRKVGGTESYIRNLLHGFGTLDNRNEYVLFTAGDNDASFRGYAGYPNMALKNTGAVSESPMKRIIWENLHLDRLAGKEKIEVMFIPVYSKPRTYGSGIPYVTCIHDIQAVHFPQYFSMAENLALRYFWRYACKSSQAIVAISHWCREDIQAHYRAAEDKIQTIYNPCVTVKETAGWPELSKKLGIGGNTYFYVASSMLPHKNLGTLLKTFALRKAAGKREPLVISGIGGGGKQDFDRQLKKLAIEDMVIDTGFVTDAERDCLYDHCQAFLFPSLFEGFGMPPVEAMQRGKTVITTRCSCIEEVTGGRAVYVDDPMDEREWERKIRQAAMEGSGIRPQEFRQYSLEAVTGEYVELFERVKEGAANKRLRLDLRK